MAFRDFVNTYLSFFVIIIRNECSRILLLVGKIQELFKFVIIYTKFKVCIKNKFLKKFHYIRGQ